jgi:hypothetical protein
MSFPEVTAVAKNMTDFPHFLALGFEYVELAQGLEKRMCEPDLREAQAGHRDTCNSRRVFRLQNQLWTFR